MRGRLMRSGSDYKVSACLVSWRRPANVELIVGQLHELPFIDEILVWNNSPETELRLTGEKVKVFRSSRNHGCHGRYLCAARARNRIVYTQDDDALVMNIPELYDSFLADPERISHGLSDWHYERRRKQFHGECHVALLGWGAFFDRAWIAALERLPAEVRGTELFRREADKYFTVLQHRRHNTLRSALRQLPGHSDPGLALWKEPRHRECSARAVRDALAFSRGSHRPYLPPRWNVVITSRDYAAYLEESVRSAALNEADSVITVVDDGSVDGSAALARSLADEHGRIDVIELTRHAGPGAAANRGIGSNDSTFVVRLDADDRMGPDYLRAADHVLARGADVANPDAILFGDETSRWPVPDEVDLQMLLTRNPVHCASGFRRSHWGQVGGFDERLPLWVDYDFWIRLAAVGARIRKVPGDHFYYRRHEGSLSRTDPDREVIRHRLRTKHEALFRAHGR